MKPLLIAACALAVSGCAPLNSIAQPTDYPDLHLGSQQPPTLSEVIAVTDHPSMTEIEKVVAINTLYNRIRYARDEHQFDQEDYWATPQEILSSQQADCEDYALAKYLALRKAGVPDDKLYISYATNRRVNEAHMVLTYHDNGQVHVLDNMKDNILTREQATDLSMVYGFNEHHMTLYRENSPNVMLGNSQRMSLWTDFMERADMAYWTGSID